MFCCVVEADLDEQLDDVEASEMAEEELNEVNDGGNDTNEDVEQEDKENDEAVDEQQTEEVSTTFDLLPVFVVFEFIYSHFIRHRPSRDTMNVILLQDFCLLICLPAVCVY